MNVHLIPENKVAYPGGTFKVPRPDKGLIPQLARYLVEEGYDPATKITVYREGNIVFNPVPLSRWADLSVSETPKQCAKFVKYEPFPENLKKEE